MLDSPRVVRTEASLPLALFEYDLPPDLIAQAPARPRDSSRLMVLPRNAGALSHRVFRELASLLTPGDLLVVNRTRVIPARLHVRRAGGAGAGAGGAVELLFVRPLDGGIEEARRWSAIGRPGRALAPGRILQGPDGLQLRIEGRKGMEVEVSAHAPLWPVLSVHGEMPLPPYIDRPAAQPSDGEDYQTLFARERGAVAAPTAGLHFTDRVVRSLGERGIAIAELVLHVGPGTFLPVRSEHAGDVRQHPMHEEHYSIPSDTLTAIRAAKAAGRRVIAVGTTTVRALESWAATGAASGASALFIYPGFEFRVIDALVTNFHLSRSTLLMLVSAFAGRERVLAAYATAVTEHYRFFSYGDAMLII
jgi:S-adenosylmethionine:tRNA ribosyltransferase-isomerase